MREQDLRHEALGLSVAEAAFYDAIVQNDSAVLSMGDATLRKIAVDLVYAVRSSASIDWNLKDRVRTAMRSKVRKRLDRYDYPPDRQEQAVELVLQQAELFASADVTARDESRTPRM